jgi:hypothetical protein
VSAHGITVPALIALYLGLELKPTNGTLTARTETPTGYDLRRDATKNRQELDQNSMI